MLLFLQGDFAPTHGTKSANLAQHPERESMFYVDRLVDRQLTTRVGEGREGDRAPGSRGYLDLNPLAKVTK
jgi:hypothetical protein